MAFAYNGPRNRPTSLSPPGSASFRSPLHSMTTASSPETTITRSPSPYSQHAGPTSPDYTYLEGQASSKSARARHFMMVWHSLSKGDADSRPQHPYTDLIKLCILKRSDAKLTLNQLYHDLEEKFAFFAAPKNGKGWKNTLRHNLSTQPYFIKLDREHGQSGKGHYWTYEPHLEKPSSLAQSSILQHSPSWSSFLPASHHSKANLLRDDWTRRAPSGPVVPSSELVWDHTHPPRSHSAQYGPDESSSARESMRERRRQTSSGEASAPPPAVPVRTRSHTHSGVGGPDRQRMRLYHLPPAVPPRRSMGDFYLSNPISSSFCAGQRRPGSPY